MDRQASRQSVYTIQTATFKDSQSAEELFAAIEERLEGKQFPSLRVEKHEEQDLSYGWSMVGVMVTYGTD